MKVLLATLVVLGALLSGCSGGGKDSGPKQSFDDLQGTATATTGVLRGVVVDERIIPIVGATVALRGAPEASNKTTDEQGRFLFSDLPAGTYFIEVSSPLHTGAQSSGDVVAGEAEPRVLRVQLERRFKMDPYPLQVVREGYFQCSQAGASAFYSSSTCVDGAVGGTVRGAYPPISNTTQQNREWHSDVGAGWQVIVFEMQWEPTSDSTSKRMGIVVSTYKPERNGAHQFAEFQGETPIRGQIDVGVEHESSTGLDPTMIPAEGITDMSYFVSVRQDGATPGIAYNQKFTVYLTMFHYGVPPEGWSFVNGDPMPF